MFSPCPEAYALTLSRARLVPPVIYANVSLGSNLPVLPRNCGHTIHVLERASNIAKQVSNSPKHFTLSFVPNFGLQKKTSGRTWVSSDPESHR